MQQEINQTGLGALVHDDSDVAREGVYRIGDLAREFDITLRALRFYEDRGLLIPARAGSTRLYSAEDRQRLKLILMAKRVGFSLTEIEEILAFDDQESLSGDSIRILMEKFMGQSSVLTEQKMEVEKALKEVSETVKYLRSQL